MGMYREPRKSIQEDPLEIGDNIRIGKITYRIMEEPKDGIIQCVPHDPDLDTGYYMEFRVVDVEERIWAEYEEY